MTYGTSSAPTAARSRRTCRPPRRNRPGAPWGRHRTNQGTRGFAGRSSWLLVAAVTALIALTTSFLFPSAFVEDSLMNRKGTGWVLGLCLIAAGCTTGGARPAPGDLRTRDAVGAVGADQRPGGRPSAAVREGRPDRSRHVHRRPARDADRDHRAGWLEHLQ